MQHLNFDTFSAGLSGDINAKIGGKDLESGQDTHLAFRNFLAKVAKGDIDVPVRDTHITLADNPAEPGTLLDAADIPETLDFMDENLDVTGNATTETGPDGTESVATITEQSLIGSPLPGELPGTSAIETPAPESSLTSEELVPDDHLILSGELRPTSSRQNSVEIPASAGGKGLPTTGKVLPNSGNATSDVIEGGDLPTDPVKEPVLTVNQRPDSKSDPLNSGSGRDNKTVAINLDNVKQAAVLENRQQDTQAGQDKGQFLGGGNSPGASQVQGGSDFAKIDLAGLQFSPVHHGQPAQVTGQRESTTANMPMHLYSTHTAGTAAWEDEFSGQVRWLSQTDLSKAQITLKPADLGSIEIRIVSTDDKASVSFVAANSSTRDVIENSLPRLRELLAGHGLTLTDTSVSHQDANNGNNRGYQQVFNRSDNRFASSTAGQDVTASGEMVIAHRNDGQVDYYV